MREWTLTLPRQLPLWEMESQWTLEISENDLRGQNSMACSVLYIIGKLLKRRCLKWARISHLEFETQVMAKRRAGSQIANLTPNQKKSGIDSIYLAADNVWHIVENLLTRATTFLQTAPRSEVCSQSYGAPKSRESPLAGFQDSHAGVPREKSHLDVGPVKRRGPKYTIRGRWWLHPSPGRGESCVSVLLVVRPSTKGAPTMH